MAGFMRARGERQWQHWLSLVLGCVLALSPWIVEQGMNVRAIVVNAMVVGLAIAFVAGMEIDALKTWEEWVSCALGLWIAASPLIFGYAQLGTLTAMHVLMGGVVAALAAMEWWQDRKAAERR
jgi:ubiquinone biosynthesis protein UbiJ